MWSATWLARAALALLSPPVAVLAAAVARDAYKTGRPLGFVWREMTNGLTACEQEWVGDRAKAFLEARYAVEDRALARLKNKSGSGTACEAATPAEAAVEARARAWQALGLTVDKQSAYARTVLGRGPGAYMEVLRTRDGHRLYRPAMHFCVRPTDGGHQKVVGARFVWGGEAAAGDPPENSVVTYAEFPPYQMSVTLPVDEADPWAPLKLPLVPGVLDPSDGPQQQVRVCTEAPRAMVVAAMEHLRPDVRLELVDLDTGRVRCETVPFPPGRCHL